MGSYLYREFSFGFLSNSSEPDVFIGGGMVYFIKVSSKWSVVIGVFAVLLILLVTPELISPALAQPPEMNTFTSTIEFQDPPATVQVSDLSGNLVGEGEHGGRIRCFKNNCNKGTQLQLNGVEYI